MMFKVIIIINLEQFVKAKCLAVRNVKRTFFNRMNFAQLLDSGSATLFQNIKKGRSLLGLFLKPSSSEGSFREVQTDFIDLDVNLFIRQLFHPVVTIY